MSFNAFEKFLETPSVLISKREFRPWESNENVMKIIVAEYCNPRS